MINISLVKAIQMIISIIIYGTIFYFVLNMEKKKCKCTEDTRRDIIKWYSLGLIVFTVLSPLIPIKYEMVITTIIGFCSLAYFVVLFTYTHSLKHKKNCECSNTWRRTFTFIYSIIALVIMPTLFIFIAYLYYKIHNLKKLFNNNLKKLSNNNLKKLSNNLKKLSKSK